MALQAIIRHGNFASIEFPADEGVIAMQTTTVQAGSTKTLHLAAASSGGLHGFTYTNPTLTFTCSGIVTDVDGLFVLQSGEEMATFENFTNLVEFAAFTPAATYAVFEDPALNPDVDNTLKMSFNVFVVPTLPAAPAP
jgi:hypothetical protein